MPIYMDRHDLPGVTAKNVAEAHQEDLKIQEQYGCRALTYWFDEDRGTAFCLIEAPNKDAVQAMHERAHGLIPNQLIEVDSSIVEAFLGRIEQPETSSQSGNSEHIAFNDPAFRTVLAAHIKSSAVLNSTLDIAEARKRLDFYKKTIRTLLKKYGGTEVCHSGNGFLASFVSASQAILCAIEIQKNGKQPTPSTFPDRLQIQIGISAGDPVTESPDLFGQTVQTAKRLCEVACNDQIMISLEVRNLHRHEGLTVIESAIKTVTLMEEKFLNQLLDIAEKVWKESGFTILDLAKQTGLSKSQLYRNTVSVTGHSPNDFMKEFRLNKAAQMLEKQAGNISEVAYQSGFSSPSYFSKCFLKKFGILPSEYATAMTDLRFL